MVCRYQMRGFLFPCLAACAACRLAKVEGPNKRHRNAKNIKEPSLGWSSPASNGKATSNDLNCAVQHAQLVANSALAAWNHLLSISVFFGHGVLQSYLQWVSCCLHTIMGISWDQLSSVQFAEYLADCFRSDRKLINESTWTFDDAFWGASNAIFPNGNPCHSFPWTCDMRRKQVKLRVNDPTWSAPNRSFQSEGYLTSNILRAPHTIKGLFSQQILAQKSYRQEAGSELLRRRLCSSWGRELSKHISAVSIAFSNSSWLCLNHQKVTQWCLKESKREVDKELWATPWRRKSLSAPPQSRRSVWRYSSPIHRELSPRRAHICPRKALKTYDKP